MKRQAPRKRQPRIRKKTIKELLRDCRKQKVMKTRIRIEDIKSWPQPGKTLKERRKAETKKELLDRLLTKKGAPITRFMKRVFASAVKEYCDNLQIQKTTRDKLHKALQTIVEENLSQTKATNLLKRELKTDLISSAQTHNAIKEIAEMILQELMYKGNIQIGEKGTVKIMIGETRR